MINFLFIVCFPDPFQRAERNKYNNKRNMYENAKFSDFLFFLNVIYFLDYSQFLNDQCKRGSQKEQSIESGLKILIRCGL